MPLQATSGAATYDAFGGGVPVVPTYIEEIFQTWLYTTTGANITVNNGIDLLNKGGMTIQKLRSTTSQWYVTDTSRGAGVVLYTNLINGQANNGSGTGQFLSNGFVDTNQFTAGATEASWTFRKQPKFFDVVTYTGDGANRTISHNLGSVPGCIIVKRTDASANWQVYHRSLANTEYMLLNTTAAKATGTTRWNSTTPTSTVFSLGTDATVNANGGTYVAYIFAHDAGGFGLTGTDNVISCGSYTGNGSATGPVVTLGYEPQWVMLKNTSFSSNWYMLDVMRGMAYTVGNELYANLTAAEITQSKTLIPTATGFNVATTDGEVNTNGNTYIYIAIRRGPMKTPTTGTSVFAVANQAHSGSPTVITAGFPVDLLWNRQSNVVDDWYVIDRLRGNSPFLLTNSTAAEDTSGTYYSLTSNTTVTDSNHGGSNPLANYMFRRAPGFFDEVCYTGTGTNTAFNHNLGVTPEMMITKIRDSSIPNWGVWHNALSPSSAMLFLNTTGTQGNGYVDTVTSTTFSFATANGVVNTSPKLYVAYLFASCPGVSKVGSYTGTGALQTINCGFTGGARFVLIKRTDSTGDWWVYDSARGITSGNDPYLFLNSTAAEVTGTNYVDTDSTGFKVTAAAPAGLNANGGTFIFLAIA